MLALAITEPEAALSDHPSVNPVASQPGGTATVHPASASV
jgi:hypothetical protein